MAELTQKHDPYANDEITQAGNPRERSAPGKSPGEAVYEKVTDRSGRVISNKPANAGFLAWQNWKTQEEEKQRRRDAGEILAEDIPEPWTLKRIALTFGTLVLLSMMVSNFVTGTAFWGMDKPVVKYAKGVIWPANTVFTLQQLSAYDGSNPGKPIYLSLDGEVYDVTSSRRMYGPGGSYSFMSGKDASRAFVTGCFDTHQTHDLRGISESEQHALDNWKTFFRKHEKYTKVGTVDLPYIDPSSPIPPSCNVAAGDENGPKTGASSHPHSAASKADAPPPVEAQPPRDFAHGDANSKPKAWNAERKVAAGPVPGEEQGVKKAKGKAVKVLEEVVPHWAEL